MGSESYATVKTNPFLAVKLHCHIVLTKAGLKPKEHS